jgi:hypothetical protein
MAAQRQVDLLRQWAERPGDPSVTWQTVRAVTAAAAGLLNTLDYLLAGIGSAGPIEVSDDTFALRGQLEVAAHILGEFSAGPHRSAKTPPAPDRRRPVTVVCDIDDDPPALLVVLAVDPGHNPYEAVDSYLVAAGVTTATPMLAFTGDITSLVTPGSLLQILRIPD